MAKQLKWKEYDYKVQVGPGNSWLYRPLLEIEVSSKSNSARLPLLAMIDSGTDSTVLHIDLAHRLRIDLSSCQKVKLGGIGTTFGYISTIQLIVPSINVSMDIPAMFAENLPLQGLLGQRHFFQRFKIRFEKDKNKFYLAAV